MEEKWRKLYQVLSASPKYKFEGDENAFYEKFSDPEKLKKLHGVLIQDPMFKNVGTFEEFQGKFFPDGKKKIQAEPSTSPSTTSGAMDSTVLVSETPQQPTSSGLPQSQTQNFSGVSVAPTQEQQLGAIQGQQGEPLLGEQIAQEALPTKEEEKRYYTLPSGKKVELAPKDYSEERGTLKSVYTRLDKAAAEQLSSLASVPKSLYELASIPQNKLAEEMNMPWLKSNWETAKQTVDVFGTLEQLDQTGQAYSDYAEEKQKEISSAYDKTITEYIKEGDYDTAARAVVDGVAEAAPFTATVVFTGGGTGSLSRAKSVGTITTLSYPMQKQQIMQEYPDMSEEEASRVAASLAIWEGVMEQYTQKIGRVAFGTYKKKGLDEAQKQLTNTFKETVRKVADKITDSPAGQIIGSGAEEGATQLVQNFTKVVQAEGRMPTTEELLEGVPDATIIGAAMGGGFALSTATQQTQDDSQDQTRVSGEERVGEEPVQAEPEQVTSEEEVSDGGVVQKEQVQTEEVTPKQEAKEDVADVSTEQRRSKLSPRALEEVDLAFDSSRQKERSELLMEGEISEEAQDFIIDTTDKEGYSPILDRLSRNPNLSEKNQIRMIEMGNLYRSNVIGGNAVSDALIDRMIDEKMSFSNLRSKMRSPNITEQQRERIQKELDDISESTNLRTVLFNEKSTIKEKQDAINKAENLTRIGKEGIVEIARLSDKIDVPSGIVDKMRETPSAVVVSEMFSLEDKREALKQIAEDPSKTIVNDDVVRSIVDLEKSLELPKPLLSYIKRTKFNILYDSYRKRGKKIKVDSDTIHGIAHDIRESKPEWFDNLEGDKDAIDTLRSLSKSIKRSFDEYKPNNNFEDALLEDQIQMFNRLGITPIELDAKIFARAVKADSEQQATEMFDTFFDFFMKPSSEIDHKTGVGLGINANWYGSTMFTSKNLLPIKGYGEYTMILKPKKDNPIIVTKEDVVKIFEREGVSTFDEVAKKQAVLDKYGIDGIQYLSDLNAIAWTRPTQNLSLELVKKTENLTSEDLEGVIKQKKDGRESKEDTSLGQREQQGRKEKTRSRGVKEDGTVTMSERQALKEQLRNQARGSRSAMTEQRSFQKQVSESLNDIPFRSKLSGNQVRAIIRKAGKVLADRPESVDNFLEYVDRVVSDANFANDVQDAASAKRRLKKKLKDENLPANRKEAIRRLTDIEPSELQDPKEFSDLANRVLKTTKKGTRGIVPDAEINEFVDNNSDALTKEKETIESRIEKNLESIARSEEEMLDTLIEEGYGDVDENTSSEELRRVFNEYLNEQHSAKVSEKRAEVKEQLENAPDNKLLNEVRGANLEGIPFDELVFISDVLENFSVNQEIFNLGNAVNIIRANNDGNLITERVERTKKATGIKLGNLNFAQTIIGTMSNIYQKIYRSNKKLMTYVSDKFGDVQRDRAAAKMIRMSSEKQNAYNKEVNKLNRDYGVRLESFANQARISIRAILDQPPLRVRQGQQTYEEFIQNVKDNIVQSIAVLRAEGNDTHADELQKIYDEQLKDIQTNEDFVLSEPEAKVLEFMREMHSEREADIEEFLAMYKNEVLDKDTPYTAIRIVKQSEPVLMETSEDLVSNFTKTNIQAPKSANLIERNRGSYKLAPNARYSFDFSSNQFNAYQRTNMEVLMSPITKKMAYIMNSGRFNDAFGGIDNVNKIKGLLNDQLTSRYAITNLYNAGDLGKILGKKVTIKTVSELERRLRNLSARYVFGVSQLIKQSPVVINTLREHPVAFITHMGKMMSDASYRKAARDIMSESTVGVRDIVTENIAQESLLFRSETKKGRVARNLSTMDKKAGEAVLFPLRITDRIVARASFMAYYKAYIEEQGGVFDIQNEADNINSEAMSYAEIRIRQYQNASITEAASRYQNVSGAFRVMRGILMPFSSFNANRNSTMVTDYQNLAYSTAKVKEAIKNGDTEALSEASRVASESVKSLAGLTLETLAFNYAGRAAMIYLVDLLFSLMYDEEEYVDGESQLIKDDKESKKRISNTVLDMIPLVGMYDGTKIGASELINMGYYQMDEANKMLTYEEYKQAGYTPITYYSPRGVGDASWLDALGQYSIPIESAVNSIELFDNAQDGFMVDKNGNKIYLYEFQRKDAMKSAILGMLASAGYGVAEMNFANSKLKFELEKDGYKSEMERAIMQRVKESYKETYDDLISEMLSDVDEFEDFKRDVNDGYLDPVEQMDGAISGSVKKLMTKDRGRNQLYRTVSSKKNTRVRSAYLYRLLKGKSDEEVKQAYADIFVNSMMLQGGMSAEEALEVIARTSRLLKEGKK